jgi:hypothetical protein
VASFEDRLWSELVGQHGAVLAEQPARSPAAPRFRRATAAALVLALAVSLAALVIVLGKGGGTNAYAVVRNPDGTVTVAINELEGVEPANQRLQELGVPVRIPPVRSGCPTSRADLQAVHLPPDRTSEIFEPTGGHGNSSLRIEPAAIPHGDNLVLRAYELRPGLIGIRAVVIEGPAPSCLAPEQGE